jgi:hypothetical protein
MGKDLGALVPWSSCAVRVRFCEEEGPYFLEGGGRQDVYLFEETHGVMRVTIESRVRWGIAMREEFGSWWGNWLWKPRMLILARCRIELARDATTVTPPKNQNEFRGSQVA